MENFNYYIRKIFILKLVMIFMFVSLIGISIFGDLKLFLDYRYLKSEYADLEEINIKNQENEDMIKALKEFNQTYAVLDKQLLKKQLDDMGGFEYDKMSFSQEGNTIGFNSKSLSQIEFYSKLFNEKGYTVNVIAVEKNSDEVYFEMEVN